MKRGAPLKRSAPKRTQPRRYWGDAEEKRGPCRLRRLGGCSGPVELAHLVGRKHDEPWAAPEWQASAPFDLYVHPEAVVPMCRAHHMAYDAHTVDALPFLTVAEQERAVLDAGGIALAFRRLSGSRHPEGTA